MVTNDELFRKMMRFSREVRMRKFHGEGRRCPMPPMMHGMMLPEAARCGEAPFAQPMPHMPGMPMPHMPGMPMGPHCKGLFGKGPHGPGKHGRGMSRERLLVLLAEHPEGMWQKDLAWEADINASSASELIGRLEADGFVTREADENDRRAALLKLTEAGQARADELRAEREGFLTDLFSKLTEDEKETLSTLLDKLLG